VSEARASISFVLPMFNEKDNIDHTVDVIAALARETCDDYEIIIVDDCSTDGSGQIVDRMAQRDPAIRPVHLERNTKFGGAYAEGFRRASKDLIVYLDSDLPVRSADIRQSLPLIAEADIVTGCSRIEKGDTLKRKVISGAYNFLVERLFGLGVADINSGYKVVRRELVRDLNFRSQSPFVNVELFIHARRKNGRVVQFPLVFLSRPAGRSRITTLPVILATAADMLRVWLANKA